LTDNVDLGHTFRKHYVRGLRRLLCKGDLQIGGSVEFLKDFTEQEKWLSKLEQTNWNVFIQGPPEGKSNPANVVKYLAGYLTGGPISDRRIIKADEDEVWFWARPKKTTPLSQRRRGMNKAQPYRLSGLQFMQRWALHILPKGFTRSRSYGGYHGSNRETYIQACRELLGTAPNEDHTQEESDLAEELDSMPERTCPHCESELEWIKDLRTRHLPQRHLLSPASSGLRSTTACKGWHPMKRPPIQSSKTIFRSRQHRTACLTLRAESPSLQKTGQSLLRNPCSVFDLRFKNLDGSRESC